MALGCSRSTAHWSVTLIKGVRADAKLTPSSTLAGSGPAVSRTVASDSVDSTEEPTELVIALARFSSLIVLSVDSVDADSGGGAVDTELA